MSPMLKSSSESGEKLDRQPADSVGHVDDQETPPGDVDAPDADDLQPEPSRSRGTLFAVVVGAAALVLLLGVAGTLFVNAHDAEGTVKDFLDAVDDGDVATMESIVHADTLPSFRETDVAGALISEYHNMVDSWKVVGGEIVDDEAKVTVAVTRAGETGADYKEVFLERVSDRWRLLDPVDLLLY